ncbi:MAG: response regulator [Sphingomonadales bacterium]|nr:response regulator [Sphingomonadales bacterium]
MTSGGTLEISQAAAVRPVVILDDDDDFREALAGGIAALGYATAHFGGIDELLVFLAGARPLCLLLDYHLPGDNGLAVQARLAEARPRVPIVFVSACYDAKVSRAALASGAVAFLNKPVRLAELERVIEELARNDLATS